MKVSKIKENNDILVIMEFYGIEKPTAAQVIGALLRKYKKGFETIAFQRDLNPYKTSNQWYAEFYMKENDEKYLDYLLEEMGA